MLRLKALFDCLYFAFIPSFVYEDESHYGDSFSDYLNHIKINARVAKHWLTGTETEGMIRLAKSKTTYIK